MNVHVRNLTPTQIESIERHKRFRAAIQAKAYELMAQSARVEAAIVVATIEPEAMPAETDPPVEQWQEILNAIDFKRKFPTVANIQKLICKHYQLTRSELLSAQRSAYLIRPRHIAFYLAKTLTPHSLPEIGRRFGGRDHTTVLHGVRKIASLIRANKTAFEDVAALTAILLAEVGQ